MGGVGNFILEKLVIVNQFKNLFTSPRGVCALSSHVNFWHYDDAQTPFFY